MIKKSISENYFSSFKSVCHDLAPHAKTVMNAANALRSLKAAFPRVLALLQLALAPPTSTTLCEVSFCLIEQVRDDTNLGFFKF